MRLGLVVRVRELSLYQRIELGLRLGLVVRVRADARVSVISMDRVRAETKFSVRAIHRFKFRISS